MRTATAQFVCIILLVTATNETDVDARARGTKVSGATISANGVRFQTGDESLPWPVPDDPAVHAQESPPQRLLRVTGLPDRRYKLTIDGARVLEASPDEWAGGVALGSGPEFQQARELRRTINRKDMYFFHRWRAHNSEYIYGRRSRRSKNWTRKRARGNAGKGKTRNPPPPHGRARTAAKRSTTLSTSVGTASMAAVEAVRPGVRHG